MSASYQREIINQLVREPIGTYMTIVTFDPAVDGMVEFIMVKTSMKEWRNHLQGTAASGKGWLPVSTRDLALGLDEYSALWWCS